MKNPVMDPEHWARQRERCDNFLAALEEVMFQVNFYEDEKEQLLSAFKVVENVRDQYAGAYEEDPLKR